MNPGFSERTFEFCFNSEFCSQFGGLLASHPHLPSQNLEKDLGYDVEFEIQQSQFTHSIFIQHKVACYAEVRSGKNGKYYDYHKGPYFRFGVDNHQHNVLHELSASKGNAYYCAPLFYQRNQLADAYRLNAVGDRSIILDPVEVGDVIDGKRHNITFSPQGLNACLHSDPRPFKTHYSGSRRKLPEFRIQEVTLDYIQELAESLVSRVRNTDASGRTYDELRSFKPIQQVQYALARVYFVSWILVK